MHQKLTTPERTAIYSLICEAVPEATQLPSGLVEAMIDGKRPEPVKTHGSLQINVDWSAVIDLIIKFLAIVGPAVGIVKNLNDLLKRKPTKEEIEEKLMKDPGTAELMNLLTPERKALLLSRIADL